MKLGVFSTNTYRNERALTAVSLMELAQGKLTPRRLYDPETGHSSFQDSLTIARAVEQAGLDFVSVSEHHYWPLSLEPNAGLYAAALTQVLKKASIAWIGPVTSINNPVRIAEEIAMLDQMLGPGRLTVYLLKGTPNEHMNYGYSPEEARARNQEAALLIKKALTEPEPFRWEGTYFNFGNVSVWPGCTTQPHPILYTSGSGPEAVQFAADNGFGIAIHGGDVQWAKQTVDLYRSACENAGWAPTPDHVIARGACAIGESDAHAEEIKAQMAPRVDLQARSAEILGSAQHGASAAAAAGGAAPGPLFPMMLHGSPGTAIEQAREFARAGVGVADLIMQFGGLPLETELGVIKRLGEIAPAVRELQA
jgi:alkanesulfonate monooxygenase SsuD/methylene tetrahydromethanopterin reductase-like flavin-dependent oxidoreductase (luciferase family)